MDFIGENISQGPNSFLDCLKSESHNTQPCLFLPTINFPIHSPSLLLKTFTESPDLSLKTFNNLCNTLEFKFILAFLDYDDSEYILVLNL